MNDLFRYKCPHCGAAKEVVSFDYEIRCDHCGGTITWDFDGYLRSDKAAAAMDWGAELAGRQKERNRLARLMEEALVNRDVSAWRRAAEAYYRIEIETMPPSLLMQGSEGHDPGSVRSRMLASTVEFWQTVHFRPAVQDAYQETTRLWDRYCATLSVDTLIAYIEAWKPYYEQAYKYWDPAKFGIGNFSIESTIRQAQINLISAYIHPLSGIPAEQKTILSQRFSHLDPTIAHYANKTKRQDPACFYKRLFSAVCPACGLPRAISAPGSGILYCGLCRYYEDNRPGEEDIVEIPCDNCGARIVFIANESTVSCPSCGGSFRFLEPEGKVTRATMQFLARRMESGPPRRGVLEDPIVLRRLELEVKPVWESLKTDRCDPAEAVSRINRLGFAQRTLLLDQLRRFVKIDTPHIGWVKEFAAFLEPTGLLDRDLSYAPVLARRAAEDAAARGGLTDVDSMLRRKFSPADRKFADRILRPVWEKFEKENRSAEYVSGMLCALRIDLYYAFFSNLIELEQIASTEVPFIRPLVERLLQDGLLDDYVVRSRENLSFMSTVSRLMDGAYQAAGQKNPARSTDPDEAQGNLAIKKTIREIRDHWKVWHDLQKDLETTAPAVLEATDATNPALLDKPSKKSQARRIHWGQWVAAVGIWMILLACFLVGSRLFAGSWFFEWSVWSRWLSHIRMPADFAQAVDAAVFGILFLVPHFFGPLFIKNFIFD